MKNNRLINIPINEKVYLIDEFHNFYIGTVTKRDNELYKGECYQGDPDAFYRNAIVDWAYI